MCQKIDMDWSHVRSLTVFGERSLGPSPLVCSPDMRMLRALDLENAQFRLTQKDISNIGLLRHFKYLNFYPQRFSITGELNPQVCSPIYKLPRSIGKLQGLRTLNIRDSYITEIPTEISKLKSLHSLRCTRKSYYDYFDLPEPKKCLERTFCLPMVFALLLNPDDRAEAVAELHMAWSSCWSKSEGVSVPKGIGNIKELQILAVVDIRRTSDKAVKELGELVQLRKLSVVTEGATKEKCKVLCDAIQKLTCLRSLQVNNFLSGSGVTVEWLHVVPSPPLLLRSLKLQGCLGEIPGWFGNLMYLVKLYLWDSVIKEEGKIMEILGPLPNLMVLRLGKGSYIGKLAFKTRAFPNLKELYISCLTELRELVFEEGTSPQLGKIYILRCALRSGITGISHLPRLKKISLGYTGQVAKLAMLQSEVGAHPNSPVLGLGWDRRRHDLGDTGVQVGEATGESSPLHPEPAAVAESSGSQQVAMATTNVRSANCFSSV